ncbi:MAG TPA: DUF4153 domain-containing protein [Allosphingosinicella sp.]
MSEAEPVEHEPWPLRAAILVALGAACALIVYHITRGTDGRDWTDAPLRMAAGGFLAAGALIFALTLERLRWRWAAAFAAAAGLVVALVVWWNGSPEDWGTGEGWKLVAALIAIALAVPLFQAARDSGTRRFAVRAAHVHAWTDLILWFAACAFVAATLLLTFLLHELFRLIGIEVIGRAFDAGWLPAPLIGAALGGAIGLLRDRNNVLEMLQKMVRAILSVLAPVLALGLILFVAALPFTGLEPLWSQTKSTTPILIICILGAVALVNAVIGNAADEEGRSPLLRWPAMALAAVTLPLAIVAAVSTAKRIGQYGFTPDRLWAAVIVAGAIALALAYLLSLVLRRGDWPAALRRANVRLAIGLSALALFLALPFVSFGAISARDQAARLEAGKVSPDRFDWAAMRFDFGPAGLRALERLARSGPAEARPYARRALAAQHRWPEVAHDVAPPQDQTPDPAPKLRVTPAGAAVPPVLLDLVASTVLCAEIECRLVFDVPGRAILIGQPCAECEVHVRIYRADGEVWRQLEQHPGSIPAPLDPPGRHAGAERQRQAIAAGRVEVRAVEKRQVFVDGEPVGPVFEP